MAPKEVTGNVAKVVNFTTFATFPDPLFGPISHKSARLAEMTEITEKCISATLATFADLAVFSPNNGQIMVKFGQIMVKFGQIMAKIWPNMAKYG